MINKSIMLQKYVAIENETEKKEIAYLTAQIGQDYGVYNISIQITNKSNLLQNEEYFKSEYESFKEEVELEASNFGWNIFRNL